MIGNTVARAVKIFLLAVMIWWIVTPMISLALWSIAIKWYWPSPVPQEVGLNYWLEALGIRKGYAIGAVSITSALVRSLTIAPMVAILAQLIAIPASYAFARMSVPLKPLALFLFILPQAFPLMPIYVGMMKFFYSLDLVGTYWGVVMAHLLPSLVFAVWINTATFRSIPPELEEAARVSGAGPITTAVKILLPLAAPGLLASTAFVFLYSLDEFTGTFFIGLPNVVTLPMLLYSASGYNLQFASATAIVLLAISAVFMIILERALRPELLGRVG